MILNNIKTYMSRFSQERRLELMAKIQSLAIRKPSITCDELAGILDIDRMTVHRLKKQVHADNLKYIKEQEIDKEIAKLEKEYEAIGMDLWEIASQKKTKMMTKDGTPIEIDASKKVIVQALRNLMDLKQKLFDIKFDAGLFKRDLGAIKYDGVVINIKENRNGKPTNNRRNKSTGGDKKKQS